MQMYLVSLCSLGTSILMYVNFVNYLLSQFHRLHFAVFKETLSQILLIQLITHMDTIMLLFFGIVNNFKLDLTVPCILQDSCSDIIQIIKKTSQTIASGIWISSITELFREAKQCITELFTDQFPNHVRLVWRLHDLYSQVIQLVCSWQGEIQI